MIKLFLGYYFMIRYVYLWIMSTEMSDRVGHKINWRRIRSQKMML